MADRTLHVRPYSKKDYPICKAIAMENMLQYHYWQIAHYGRNGEELYWKTHVGKTDTEVYIFTDDDNIVGYLALHFKEDDFKGTILEIGDFQVRKELQGKKIGSTLLNWVEEFAIDKKITHLRLYVYNLNPAKKLYEKQGFKVTKIIYEANASEMMKDLK